MSKKQKKTKQPQQPDCKGHRRSTEICLVSFILFGVLDPEVSHMYSAKESLPLSRQGVR